MKKPSLGLLMALAVAQSAAVAQDSTFNSQGPGQRMRQKMQQVRSGAMQRGLQNQAGANSSLNSGSLLNNTAPSMLEDPFAKKSSEIKTGAPPALQNLPDGSKLMRNSDGGSTMYRQDGSVLESRSDGTKVLTTREGKEGILNADGSGSAPDGTKMTRDPDGSWKAKRTDGLGFQQKPDGTQIFERSNGLETVKTPDGKIYMRDSKTKQVVRQIIK